MLRIHPLFLRLLLAAIAVIFICLLGFAGLGWAVWKRHPWLLAVLGDERLLRLRPVYLKTAAAMWPGDQDGDGFCDGLERFMEYDPQNPLDHPQFDLRCERDHIDAHGIGKSTTGFSAHNTLLLQPGEKITVRMRFNMHPELQGFAAGFALQISPSSHLQLAAPGGPLSSNALSLPCPKERILVFDLAIAPSTVPSPGAQPLALDDMMVPPVEEEVRITNPVTRELLGTLSVWCVWKLPPVPPKLDFILLQATLAMPGQTDQRYIQLNWPGLTAPADALVIEAARDPAGTEWFPMHISPPHVTEAGMCQFIGEGHYFGLLKFRVVPIRYFPP
jgi:hypothetical protein